MTCPSAKSSDPQSAERIIELTETRKSLDSFDPPLPVPVAAQMASMQVNLPGEGGDTAVTPQAQAPMDADG